MRYLGQVGMISREREPSRRDVYLVLEDLWYEVSIRQDQLLTRWASAARDVDILGSTSRTFPAKFSIASSKASSKSTRNS